MRIMGIAAAIAVTFGAGACTVSIDEASVFPAVPFNTQLAAEAGAPIVDEKAFGSEAAWAGVWRSRAARGGMPETVAPYIAAKVEHGRSAAAPGGLAWTTFTREAPNGVLIARCGGNATTRQMSGYKYAAMAVPYGDVLLFDYPGYGETGGEATAERFSAMRGELAALIREKAAGRKIVLWGHSLGGLVCSEISALLPETSGIIIETSARNAAEVAREWTPWYAAPFVRIEIAEGLRGFDSANVLKGFKAPVLVMGAEKDETLPVSLARSLGKALKAESVDAAYVEFKGGGHSNLILQPDFAPTIAAFFQRATGS